jgi:hypothetical protein
MQLNRDPHPISSKQYRSRYNSVVSNRVAEPEPEPVGTVFIWGLQHRNRNRIRNTVPVPDIRNRSKQLKIFN